MGRHMQQSTFEGTNGDPGSGAEQTTSSSFNNQPTTVGNVE